MLDQRTTFDEAIRVLHGDAGMHAVLAATEDPLAAIVIAMAPTAHPIAQSIAALQCHLISLLDPQQIIADRDIQDAVRRLIGMRGRTAALRSWARVAPVGWGAPYAADLIAAVRNRSCPPGDAAALIGPCDDAANILCEEYDIARAIHRWGQWGKEVHLAPTWWTAHLSPEMQERLYAALRCKTSMLSLCVPWLPPNVITEDVMMDISIREALEAFADASPDACTLHADLLSRLIDAAPLRSIGDLTRLAVMTGSATIWNRIREILSENRDAAEHVVAAAPWKHLHADVQTTILNFAGRSDICAAIAVAQRAAQGLAQGGEIRACINGRTAASFFAALDPKGWHALDNETQQWLLHSPGTQQWLLRSPGANASRIIRLIGLHPEVLARAELDNDLVRAARIHVRDDVALRRALFPVALRRVDLPGMYAMMSAMSEMPYDAGAFFAVASGRGDPDIIASARNILHTLDDLAVAVTIQRCVADAWRVQDVAAALHDALQGWTRERLNPILALVGDAAFDLVTPDVHAVADRIASSTHRDAMRHVLEHIVALPLEIAAPALLALQRCREGSGNDRRIAAETLARTLRDHGDRFLSIVDALPDDDDLRVALLPLPDDPNLAHALRSLARDNPDVSCHFAYALCKEEWRNALAALLMMPPRHAIAVWSALPDMMHIVLAQEAHLYPDVDRNVGMHDPVAGLAVAALHVEDDILRTSAIAALAARPELTHALLPHLPQDVHNVLQGMLRNDSASASRKASSRSSCMRR